MTMIKRRDLMKGLGAAGLVACTGVFAGSKIVSTLASAEPPEFPGFSPETADPWSQLPAILARIKPPVFPQRDFDVTKHGAVGDNPAARRARFDPLLDEVDLSLRQRR